jgi:hypothetical protein
MRSDRAHGFDHLGLGQRACHEHEQVREVAPPRARAPTLQRRDQLLRDDHGLRVGQHVDALAAEESGDRGSGRSGDHGVADVDVDAERDPCGREARLEQGADAGIHLTIADGSGGDRVGQQHHAVLDFDRRDLDDEALDSFGIVVGVQGQEVNVTRGAAQIEGRQEQPSLEHEPLDLS